MNDFYVRSQNYLRNVKIKSLFFLLAAVAFTACNEVIDTERPTIEIDLPQGGDAVYTNDGLRIVATLTDDTGLLQYKVVLNGIDSLNDVGADSTISFIMVEGVPNNEKAIYLDETFALGDTTFNGSYQLTMACIDVEGNESIRDTVNFTIRNSNDSEPPQFNVLGPTPNDTLNYGNGFSILGSTTDSQLLMYSTIYVGTKSGSDTILYFRFTNIENNIVDFSSIGWYFQVDSSWAQGAYHMYTTSWDDYSGVSNEIPFHVSY